LEHFRDWLINTQSVGYSTAYKYSRAIVTLSREFLGEKDLFNVNSYEEARIEAEYIFKQKAFEAKNNRGHNMYSCALNKYLLYKKN